MWDVHQTKATAATTELLERIGGLYAVEEQVRGQPQTSDAMHGNHNRSPSSLWPREQSSETRRRFPSCHEC
ncbi:MAG: hypothetical protein ACYC5H_06670 [Methylovirgula sp.]